MSENLINSANKCAPRRPRAALRNIVCISVALLIPVICATVAVYVPCAFIPIAVALQFPATPLAAVFLSAFLGMVASAIVGTAMFLLWKRPSESSDDFHGGEFPCDQIKGDPNANLSTGHQSSQIINSNADVQGNVTGHSVKTESNSVDDPQAKCDEKVKELPEDVPLSIDPTEKTMAMICDQYDVNGEDINLLERIFVAFNGNFRSILTIVSNENSLCIHDRELMKPSDTLALNEKIADILLRECSCLTLFSAKNTIHITYLPISLKKLILEGNGAKLDAQLLCSNLPNIDSLYLYGVTINGAVEVLPPTLRQILIIGGNVLLRSSAFENLNSITLLKLIDIDIGGPIEVFPNTLEKITIRPKTTIILESKAFKNLNALDLLRLKNVCINGPVDVSLPVLKCLIIEDSTLGIAPTALALADRLYKVTISNSTIKFVDDGSHSYPGEDEIDANPKIGFGWLRGLAELNIFDTVMRGTVVAFPPSLIALSIDSEMRFQKDAFRGLRCIASLFIKKASIEGNAAVDEMPIPKRSLLLGPGFKITAHLRDKLQKCPKNSIDCTVE
ncbi:MAG: hypothetical protein LBI69_03760 [Puniceicoccales bacterium]|jgi:hypothetical protein|nr:hypothetical protein [Puniceicoccales bacterium]